MIFLADEALDQSRNLPLLTEAAAADCLTEGALLGAWLGTLLRWLA